MENNPNPTPQPQAPARTLHRNSLTIKMLFIGAIMLLLLIPGSMVMSLIKDRESMMEGAQDEVARMWGGVQHLTGPVLSVPYRLTTRTQNSTQSVEGRITLLPEDLDIVGHIDCEQRRRGFYDTNVYTADLVLSGTFNLPADLPANTSGMVVDWAGAAVMLGISDLRGIEESIEIGFDGRQLATTSETKQPCFNVGVAARVDLSGWTATPDKRIRFNIPLKFKGSGGLYMAPVGNSNRIRIDSDCPTPGFCGNFLPSRREVTDAGFTAEWKVVAQNREYPQLLRDDEHKYKIQQSELGTNLLIPVTQYRQATRSVKYAALVILLTFCGVFFVEMTRRRNIHAFQYLLVGLALILFYSLLVSISEHLDFGAAYFLAAAMTVSLITFFIYGIVRQKATAACIGGLLTLLYVYIYILLQLEIFALLAGSIGLFIILAIAMHYSLKMEWTGRSEQ